MCTSQRCLRPAARCRLQATQHTWSAAVCTNSPPPLCSNSTSLCVLCPQSLHPTHRPSFPQTLPPSPDSPPCHISTFPPLSPRSVSPPPPTVCLRAENTIIYSFVFLSLFCLFSLLNAKLPAGRKCQQHGVRPKNESYYLLPDITLKLFGLWLFLGGGLPCQMHTVCFFFHTHVIFRDHILSSIRQTCYSSVANVICHPAGEMNVCHFGLSLAAELLIYCICNPT